MEREELAAWLRLTLTPGVGNATARRLLAAFGLPTSLFAQPASTLAQVVGPTQAASLRTAPPELAQLVETTWQWLHAQGDEPGQADGAGHRSILVLGDAGYPESLLNIADPPLMLYLLGAGAASIHESNTTFSHVGIKEFATNSIVNSLQDCTAQSVAIVGSRNPTPQGLDNARQFARALSQAGFAIVSGMALGVDGAAHVGALEGFDAPDAQKNNRPQRLATIAVVGTGLDRVYPKSHRTLAHAIAQNGLIISEYPLGTPPLAANFPKRNRLIAALAQGTLVVEAALKSGSLITARLAAEQGKEVFVIPGSIHSAQSRGCHALIREGAKLVESAEDVLEDLKIDKAPVLIASKPYRTWEKVEIDVPSRADDAAQPAEADGLLTALGFDPVSLDALQARTGIDTAHLQAQLMALELQGLIARLPGGLFQRMVQA